MLRFLVLYLALSLGANAALAADLAPLKQGEMKKLVTYEEPIATSEVPFVDPQGAEHSLAEYRGKVVVLNFWATWCAPCREEMPSLDRLQARLGGADMQVVTVATGRNSLPQIEKFFAEAGVSQLPVLLDGGQALARSMGVLGLPVTVLIDRDGREVARLIGGAEWDSPEALAVIDSLTAR